MPVGEIISSARARARTHTHSMRTERWNPPEVPLKMSMSFIACETFASLNCPNMRVSGVASLPQIFHFLLNTQLREVLSLLTWTLRPYHSDLYPYAAVERRFEFSSGFTLEFPQQLRSDWPDRGLEIPGTQRHLADGKPPSHPTGSAALLRQIW